MRLIVGLPGGEGKCGDAELYVACGQQGLSAGFQCGAGGYYIIYQQKMPAPDGGGVLQSKPAFYILPSFYPVFTGLCLREGRAVNNVLPNG